MVLTSAKKFNILQHNHFVVAVAFKHLKDVGRALMVACVEFVVATHHAIGGFFKTLPGRVFTYVLEYSPHGVVGTVFLFHPLPGERHPFACPAIVCSRLIYQGEERFFVFLHIAIAGSPAINNVIEEYIGILGTFA